jgi:flagellar biosynthesis/type III secretory pathway chaperone
MNEQIEFLIHALREELGQYGEMLALLEQQQQLVMQRSTDALLQNLAAVNAQTSVIEVARREREEHQRELNALLQLPPGGTFAELLKILPEPYPPLVKALVDGINQCLGRVRQRARQNHLLLSRSVEMMQRFISRLFPAASVNTYNQSGKVAARNTVASSVCEVVG